MTGKVKEESIDGRGAQRGWTEKESAKEIQQWQSWEQPGERGAMETDSKRKSSAVCRATERSWKKAETSTDLVTWTGWAT